MEAGASVQSDAGGRAIAKTGSNAVAGIALDAATQAGDTVRILRGA
ncbi:capsid cement protein [Escherichia coli]